MLHWILLCFDFLECFNIFERFVIFFKAIYICIFKSRGSKKASMNDFRRKVSRIHEKPIVKSF